jgi:hypothetical protein
MTFSLDVSEFAQVTDRRIQEVMNLVTIDMFNRIVIATPVAEENGGLLRGNWIATKARPKKRPREQLDPTGQQAAAEIKATFEKSRARTHYLRNNLPYAAIVEYGGYPNPPKTPELRQVPPGKTKNGFSTQAPQGMVRVTGMAFEKAMKQAVSRARKTIR